MCVCVWLNFAHPTMYPMIANCTRRLITPTSLFLMWTILGVSYSSVALATDAPALIKFDLTLCQVVDMAALQLG